MNIIRQRIADKRPSLGTGQWLPGGFAGEKLARLGFDWIMVDLQHGATGWDGLLETITGIENGGSAALVRVSWPDPPQIMRALDLGAIGVIVPMVETADDARMIASAAHYPPFGGRSQGFVRGKYGARPDGAEPLCLAMIETAKGMANAQAIIATSGIDGIMVGPGDLSLSLGCTLEAGLEPPVYEAIGRIADICRAEGKIAGAVAFDEVMALAFVEAGMELLCVGMDTLFLASGAAQTLDLASRLSRGSA